MAATETRETVRAATTTRAPVRAPAESDAHTTIGLISSLARDSVTLIRQEAELARAEVSEKVDDARSGITELAAGALVAYAGVTFLLLAAVLGLDLWIDEPWISAAIIGGVVTVVGLALLASARRNLKVDNLAPRRTARNLRRDADLARHEAERMKP